MKLTFEEGILVESFLTKYINPSTLSKGRMLDNNVYAVKYRTHGNTHIYEAVVLDNRMYKTEIEIDELNKFVDFECSCKEDDFCAHATALASNLVNNRHFSVSRSKKMDDKEVQKIKSDYGRKKSDVFRRLPSNANFSLGRIINILSNSRLRLKSSAVTTYLINDDSLEMKSNYYHWINHEPSVLDYSFISVKKENENLLVKCNVCAQSTNKLCDHQQVILNDQMVQTNLIKLQKGELSYHSTIEKIKNTYSISEKVIQSNFSIVIKGKTGYFLESKFPEIIFNPDKIFDFKNFLAKNPEREAEHFKIKLDNTKKGNAFLWTYRELYLLSGKLNKDKSKLISGIELESSANFLKDNLSTFYKGIKNLQASFSYREIHAYAINNLSIIKGGLNYCQHDDSEIYAVRKSDLFQIEFSEHLIESKINYTEEDGLVTLSFDFVANGVSYKASDFKYVNIYFGIIKRTAYFFDKFDVARIFKILNGNDKLIFFAKKISLDSDLFKVLNKLGDFTISNTEVEKLEGGKKQIHIREVNSFLLFEPSILYTDQRILLFEDSKIIDSNARKVLNVDEKFKHLFIEEIKNLHPKWDKHAFAQSYVYLHIDEVLENFWILDFFEETRKHNIEVFGKENLDSLKINTNRINIQRHLVSGIDWFEADVEVSYGNSVVPQKSWIEAVKNNAKYIKLNDGSLGVIPEHWVKKLGKLVSISESDNGVLKINKFKFNVLEDLFEEIDDEDIREEIYQKKKALSEYKDKKYNLPPGLKAELRLYQKEGFQWLKFLEQYGFGGCLADDMGLGKTVQVLTILLDQKIQKKKASLIIVPRSLLFNWANEIEKFTPQLKYIIYHGGDRAENLEQISDYDLVITTYDIIVRDVQKLKGIIWNYIVLDESQAIKNPISKRYKAIRLLQSVHKLAMTGTPIENNTFDLYAQFSFLNPGIFGNKTRFRNEFSVPIDKLKDAERMETLRKIIHPFLLRRTKEQVAADLPEKTESIIYCDMGEAQRKQYEELKAYIKQNLSSSFDQKGDGKAKFMILDGLLKLRQICNSPELVDATLPSKKKESVKIETLIAVLKEELGNHKALVFSQFTSMLGLIKNRLDSEGIRYAYLDGSTTNRREVVEDFKNDPACQIFLISIKAGNTGLNLTEADYVYIIDPWWNPAVEAQAIDRTHRIGQSKNVFAYKMICKDTIEEKIVELQKKKKSLAKELIQIDENVFKTLNKDELMALFD